MMKKIVLVLILATLHASLVGFSFLPDWLCPAYNARNAYKQNDFSHAQKLLEKEQVERPNDPELNYNLGATYYKQGKYDLAKENFRRAATHSFSNDKVLLEKSRFNLGNCFYKNTETMLPENWEQQEILDDAMLQRATCEVKQAIDQYKQTLDANSANKRAQTNKTAAEELYEKLMKKQRQQQQQQKQDKKDEKKQDQQQQKNDRQQKTQDQQKKDDKQQQKQQKQNKQKRKLDKQKKKESMEERRVQTLLNQLSKQEKGLQKKLLKEKMKRNAKPTNSYQKPW